MAERRAKIPLPQGGFVEGMEVDVEESTDRWSDVKLEDGTILRVKPVVLSAIRVDNAFDPAGNPQYAIKSNAVVSIVSTPDNLHRKIN